jgi:hypothetical protein
LRPIPLLQEGIPLGEHGCAVGFRDIAFGEG